MIFCLCRLFVVVYLLLFVPKQCFDWRLMRKAQSSRGTLNNKYGLWTDNHCYTILPLRIT